MTTYYATRTPVPTESGRVLSSGDRIDIDAPSGCDIAHIETGRLTPVPDEPKATAKGKTTSSKGA